ncbi:MAG: hypothetical protein ACK5BO_03415 [Bacteroidota bacterium]
MKKYLLSLSCLLIAGMLIAQPSTTVIGEKIKVTFPGPVDSTSNPMGAKIIRSASKDSTLLYAALSLDLAPMGLQAEMVSSMGDALWEQLKSGMVQQMGNVDVKKDEIVQFKGKSCLKMEIDISKIVSAEMKGKTMYTLAFFSGSVLHQLSVTANTTDSKQQDAEAFFNSLVLE